MADDAYEPALTEPVGATPAGLAGACGPRATLTRSARGRIATGSGGTSVTASPSIPASPGAEALTSSAAVHDLPGPTGARRIEDDDAELAAVERRAGAGPAAGSSA